MDATNLAAPCQAVADRPRPTLGLADGVTLVVGTVVGAMIFRAPSTVAGATGAVSSMMWVWVVGGLVSLIGALCYAELASAFPHAGGDYHFLSRAYGRAAAALYGWARMAVIQSGSIAVLAFVFGDYMAQVVPMGTGGDPALYATIAVAALTATNIAGLRQGVWVQRLLTAAKVVGILAIVGLGFGAAPAAAAHPAASGAASPSFGLAMVLVLLTYGGWNEAAYISAELKSVRRTMLATLLLGVGAIVVLYLLVNLAYVRALGIGGMAASSAVAVDLVRVTLGEGWCCALGALVAIAVLGSMNATVFTGGRSAFALGSDVPLLAALSRWSSRGATPRPALFAQGCLAIVLVVLGGRTRDGFQAMVDYTAPVFWLFFLLVGLSVFVLRHKEPRATRPFAVPLYPVTPALFCAACGYMLYSSITYAVGEMSSGQGLDGVGAFAGLGILLLGVPVVVSARLASRSGLAPLQEGEVS